MKWWRWVIVAVWVIVWLVVWMALMTGSWLSSLIGVPFGVTLVLIGRGLGHEDYARLLLREMQRLRAYGAVQARTEAGMEGRL